MACTLTLTTAESANIGVAASKQRITVLIGTSVLAQAGCDAGPDDSIVSCVFFIVFGLVGLVIGFCLCMLKVRIMR